MNLKNNWEPKRKRWSKTFRATIWERCGGKCERCTVKPAAHLHHLTYARLNHERPEDVQFLCLDCHRAKHPNHPYMARSPESRARRKHLKEDRKRRKAELRAYRIEEVVVQPAILLEVSPSALASLYRMRENHRPCVNGIKDRRCPWCRAFDSFAASFEPNLPAKFAVGYK